MIEKESILIDRLMCSLYHLDTYKRDNILLKVYKGEFRGGFTNLLHSPGNMVIF